MPAWGLIASAGLGALGGALGAKNKFKAPPTYLSPDQYTQLGGKLHGYLGNEMDLATQGKYWDPSQKNLMFGQMKEGITRDAASARTRANEGFVGRGLSLHGGLAARRQDEIGRNEASQLGSARRGIEIEDAVRAKQHGLAVAGLTQGTAADANRLALQTEEMKHKYSNQGGKMKGALAGALGGLGGGMGGGI